MDFKVIVTTPSWILSGVNVFAANLALGLRSHGVSVHILLTRPHLPYPNLMPLPPETPVEELPVAKYANWMTRLKALINYLEEQAPCIYIPNYDYEHSCVSPKLSNQVGIVGVAHSDEAIHYDHVFRLGKYWNRIVGVSQAITERIVELNPELAYKSTTIPYGVSTPDRWLKRSFDPDTPLSIVYAGRLTQHQKRILDLPKIIEALLARRVPVKLTVVGDGEDRQQFVREVEHLIADDIIQFLGILSNKETLGILKQNDVFIMMSDFEGMPISLLEGMGHGCIPVITDIRSGIPELVQDGVNGYRLPVGNIELFAERLTTLYRDVNLRKKMSLNAYQTIVQGKYQTQDMAQRYLDLFYQIQQEIKDEAYYRPPGKIEPPPGLVWQQHLPNSIRAISHGKKRVVRQILSFLTSDQLGKGRNPHRSNPRNL